jgi:hypothetical protein
MILQILMAVIRVNSLALGNKFLMKSDITVKKYHQHPLDVRHALPCLASLSYNAERMALVT